MSHWLVVLAAAALLDSGPPIDGFVRYLEDRGIVLRQDRHGWWQVERPRSEGYDVFVSLRTFPPGSSEAEMNLAYVLNPRARLAMSYPSARGTLPAGTRLDELAVRRELLRLFAEYGGP